MLRCWLPVVGAIVLAAACRTSLEDNPAEPDSGNGMACKVGTSAACMEAPNHSDLAWIEANVFTSCVFSGCHNGTATAAGRQDLRIGMSHDKIVNVDSAIESGRKLVVPGQTKQSYMMMMLRHYPPGEMEPTPVAAPPTDIGFMPQNAGGAVQCCQKLDALDRWITAGAANN